MSAFESAKLSYLQQHADGKSGMHDIGMSGEELEQRRVSAASGSVFGEVLDKCVQQITADNLADTCASVKTTLKAGLGLPTRAGAARFVVSLVNTVGNSMRDHAGPLLKALGNGLKHPSLTVRTEYGKAAAYLCRVAKNGSVRKYVQRLHEMVAQADSGDVGTRKTAGRAMVALVHHANDKVKRYMLEIMPLVFIAMHDPEAEVAEVWQSAWSTLAASPVHSMRLYLKEIVRVDVRWAACRLRVHVCGVSTQAAVVCEQMDSSSWIAKRQAAKAAQTLVNALKHHLRILSMMPSVTFLLGSRSLSPTLRIARLGEARHDLAHCSPRTWEPLHRLPAQQIGPDGHQAHLNVGRAFRLDSVTLQR